MEKELALAGFDRLLEVCRETGYPVELRPPGRQPPVAGALVAGYPFDPILAALYRRIGGGILGGPEGYLHLDWVDDEVNGIAIRTERLREPVEPFHSTVLWGGVSGLAWYYATVPVLADEQGLQPVVFMDAYDERPVKPVAANVDRFFHVFSHYVEKLVRDDAWLRGDSPEVHFPWDMVEEVARDERLVEMMKAGRFHFLMEHAPDSFEWVEQVLAARR